MPNPASDWIHIMFRQNNLYRNPSRDRELEIFNIYGEKVVGIKMSVFQESYTQNISNLAQGLYLVVIKERQKVVSYREVPDCKVSINITARDIKYDLIILI